MAQHILPEMLIVISIVQLIFSNYLTNQITISFWFRTAAYASQAILGKYGNDQSGGFRFAELSDGTVFFGVANGADHFLTNTNGPFSLNNYHHIVGVYNKSTGYFALYIDDVITVGTAYTTGNLNYTPQPTNPDCANFELGRIWSSGVNFEIVPVDIDDVRVYNRALSDNEIQALYHEGGWASASSSSSSSSSINSSYNSSSAASISTNTLLAEYLFNGNVNDTSGNGNNGIVHGAVLTNDRFGNANQAYYFNGNNNITIAGTNLDSQIITYSAWVNLSQIESQQAVLCQASATNDMDASNATHYMSIYDNTRIHLGIRNTDGSWGRYNLWNAGITISTNTWYHIVAIQDPINGFQKVYLNGIILSNITISNGKYPGVTAYTFLGSSYNGYFFNGILDDIRIYNYTLSDYEIQALYHEGGW